MMEIEPPPVRDERFPAARHGRASGFTLAELLTVIAIIALLGTLGAGAFHVARRNYALSSSAGRIEGIIRAARNSALTTGGSSFVVVDPSSRIVSACVFEPVGEWSFDGASGLAREREDASVGTAPGRVGKALDARAGTHIDAGSEARYDLRSAIFIGAWVQRDGVTEIRELPGERAGRGTRGLRSGSGRRSRTTLRSPRRAPPRSRRVLGGNASATRVPAGAIASKKGAYFFGMTRGGVLEAAIGEFRARTLEEVVPPGRWVYVTLRYDGLELDLSADGVPREWDVTGTPSFASSASSGSSERQRHQTRKRPPSAAPVTPQPLTISSPDAPFPGLIDEVRLAGSAEPLQYAYSEFEHILGWKKVIRFDRHGHLDASHHDGPVRIVLVELPDTIEPSTRTEAVVDYSVTFDEWLEEWEDPPEDLTQAGEEAKLEKRFEADGKIAITVESLGSVAATRRES